MGASPFKPTDGVDKKHPRCTSQLILPKSLNTKNKNWPGASQKKQIEITLVSSEELQSKTIYRYSEFRRYILVARALRVRVIHSLSRTPTGCILGASMLPETTAT
jgi:hypothetical protein